MSIDLTQFHQVFYEESFEGLDVMETALMSIDPERLDDETINTIFRAAHSIKGGSATFGFAVVADFTHVVETLLDQIRDGSRKMNSDLVDLFLETVDCTRDLLTALQANQQPDTSDADGLKTKFEAILATDAAAAADAATVDTAAVDTDAASALSSGDSPEGGETASNGWYVYFAPEETILCTGNEPLRMFRELEELGEVINVANCGLIPKFAQLNPENCHIQWHLQVATEAPRDQIDTVFEWVADESEIFIEPCATLLSEPAFRQKYLGSDSVTGEGSVVDDDDFVEILAEEPVAAAPLALVADATNPSISEPVAAAPVGEEKGQTNLANKTQKVNPGAESSSIRVGIDKVDNLINMVGELVIIQSMLGQLGNDFSMEQVGKLREGLVQLAHNTRELQESVMRIRMLPISFVFNRFPRMVRDLCRRLSKKIDLQVVGEQTELDKTVMEKIGDPIVHLVRNSVDHGIESPEQRLAAGKPETGVITLNAFHQGGNIIIEISDDGAGLNREKILDKAQSNGVVSDKDVLTDTQICDLIFQPGFSTADEVSDVSGRGVGMDVVRRNIQELNGTVDVVSEPGVGSVFTIRLPLTLAILDGQLVRIGYHTYVFPLVSIVESIQIKTEMVNQVAGGCDVLRLRKEYVPILRMFEIFDVEPDSRDMEGALLVVVECEGGKVGLMVDELLAQQQVVIKSLEQNYRRVEGISGATILGDGTVALILDIPGMVKIAGVQKQSQQLSNSYLAGIQQQVSISQYATG